MPDLIGDPLAMLKGQVDRVLGAGILPLVGDGADTEGSAGPSDAAEFHPVSYERSGWISRGSHRRCRRWFDHHLAHAFGMDASRHLRLGHVTDKLRERFVEQHPLDARTMAERACAEVMLSHARAKRERRLS